MSGRIYRGRYKLQGEFKITEVSLGTSDKRVAEKKLQDIITEKERERAGIIAPKIQRDSAKRPLAEHLEDYIADLITKGRVEQYTAATKAMILRLIKECKWLVPIDVRPDSFTSWRSKLDRAPKTLNEYLNSVSGMMNWMVAQGRIVANPLKNVQLIYVRGKQQKRCSFTPEQFAKLLSVSGDRGINYQMAAYTGLRVSELSNLVRADLHLDVDVPFVKARSYTTKNKQDAVIPLHPQLAEALIAHCGDDMKPTAKVLDLTTHAERPLYRDMEAADIPRMDELGRKRDFHSFRGTFATALVANGTYQRVTQELMRHSEPKLTANIYTDFCELPVIQAVKSLPWVEDDTCSLIDPHKTVSNGQILSRAVGNENSVPNREAALTGGSEPDLSQNDRKNNGGGDRIASPSSLRYVELRQVLIRRPPTFSLDSLEKKWSGRQDSNPSKKVHKYFNNQQFKNVLLDEKSPSISHVIVPLCPRLQALVTSWEKLPEHVKATIETLAKL